MTSMKLNWGTAVFIAFGLFMIFITALVVKTYQYKIELVSEDYYRQELQYQEKINKMNHVTDAHKITWNLDPDFLVLTYPKGIRGENLKGKIEFYRPSDSSKDLIVPLYLEEGGKQYIKKGLLTTGLYKMKIEWMVKGVDYYTEEDIYLQ